MSEPQQTLTIQQALDLAVQHHTAGRLSQAENIYHQILQSDPNQPIALHLLGVISHQARKNDIAIDQITRALELKPDFGEAHNTLGNVLRELGKAEEAVASYHKSLALKPDYAEAYNNLGAALQDLGKSEEAMDSYRKALAIKPDYAEAHNNRGVSLQGLGKPEEAEASYRKALELQPHYAEAHSNLGSVLGKFGKAKDAIASCQSALGLRPDLTEAHNNLGDALKSLAKHEKAAASYRKALELNPNDIKARVSLANISDHLVPLWHAPMMNDHLRNDAYLAALQKAVTADTHVLEIGTGSGLLAMMAARCRAKQVTTCEASPLIAATAEEIISTNGMAGTINVIAKNSTNLEVGVDLTHPADLLIFEIFSSEFLAEGVLSSVEDAKRRLLNPEGRMIPSRGSIMIALFGSNQIGQNVMVDEVSGFDVSKFNSITSKRRLLKATHFDIKLLTDDVEAFSFDFNEGNYFPPEQKTLRIPVTTAAECHGIIQWNLMRMDDAIIFENHPSTKTTASAWSHVAYLFDEPISMQSHQTAIVSAMHNRALPWFALESVEEHP